MSGLSTNGSISLGCALVAGRNRVPSPAAGKTALRTFGIIRTIVSGGLELAEQIGACYLEGIARQLERGHVLEADFSVQAESLRLWIDHPDVRHAPDAIFF